MTASQSGKSARRARRLSTGHGRARPDICRPSQTSRQLVQFDAFRRSFVGRFTLAPLVASARSISARPPAARKSP